MIVESGKVTSGKRKSILFFSQYLVLVINVILVITDWLRNTLGPVPNFATPVLYLLTPPAENRKMHALARSDVRGLQKQNSCPTSTVVSPTEIFSNCGNLQ